MWWPKSHPTADRCARFILTLALGGLVAGCFQPLYASRSTTDGSSVVDRLRAVEVDQVSNVANGTPGARVVAEVRNALIFELTGGAAAGRPTHRLKLNVNAGRQQVIVDITSNRPDVEQVGVDATYSLIEIASGKTVLTGQTFSRVSFDIPGQEQRFAGARGQRDAQNRAAKGIAEDIRSRLASYFIAGT